MTIFTKSPIQKTFETPGWPIGRSLLDMPNTDAANPAHILSGKCGRLHFLLGKSLQWACQSAQRLY